ncbi:MAG: hypothetical protein M3Y84_02500, partial [Acidobacteriota bacterium]|nr:hypothetical protein [Acidobacteriota bacterium]
AQQTPRRHTGMPERELLARAAVSRRITKMFRSIRIVSRTARVRSSDATGALKPFRFDPAPFLYKSEPLFRRCVGGGAQY